MKTSLLWSIFLAFFLFSCSSEEIIPLGKIYEDSAQTVDRNPVIVIHGMGGAKLIERASERVVWGAFTSKSLDISSDQGMRDLALPLGDINNFGEKKDELYACCPLDRIDVEFAGLHFSVEIYQKILQTLGVAKYSIALNPRIPHYTKGCSCYTFYYDWRQDNVANAIRLGKYLDKMTEVARAQFKAVGIEKKNIRFDVVAHSMGGLIARYFLRYGARDVLSEKNPKVTWAGAKKIARLFMVATPNGGSVDAFRSLTQGEEFAFFLPKVQPVVLFTFPSMYQLLPLADEKIFLDEQGKKLCLSLYDAQLWEKNQWGIFRKDQQKYLQKLFGKEAKQKAKIFLSQVLKRASQFHKAMTISPTTAPPSSIYLFASNTIPTLARVQLKKRDGLYQLTFTGKELKEPGDGVVPFSSALGDRRNGKKGRVQTSIPFRGVYILRGSHRKIIENPTFRNNLLYLLLEAPLDGK